MHSRTCNSVALLFIIVFVNSVLSRIVDWGEECSNSDECGDHRMSCNKAIINNVTKKICDCDSNHEWNGTHVGCVPKYSAKEILREIKDENTEAARIEREADVVYRTQVAAGITVVAFGSISSVIVAVYCCYMWKKDTNLEGSVKRMESQKEPIDKPLTTRKWT